MVKNPPASVGDVGSIPCSGRSPGEGNGNLPQYSCLEKPMDRGVWRATVHGVTSERLNKQQKSWECGYAVISNVACIFFSKEPEIESES